MSTNIIKFTVKLLSAQLIDLIDDIKCINNNIMIQYYQMNYC